VTDGETPNNSTYRAMYMRCVCRAVKSRQNIWIHRRTQDFTMEGVTQLHWWSLVWVWHGERGARAYNGGLAEPLVRGSGGEAPWSWSFLRPWKTKGDRKFIKFRTLSAYIINHRMVPTAELTTTIISTWRELRVQL